MAIPDLIHVFKSGFIAVKNLPARVLIGALPVAGARLGGVTHPTERQHIKPLASIASKFGLAAHNIHL